MAPAQGLNQAVPGMVLVLLGLHCTTLCPTVSAYTPYYSEWAPKMRSILDTPITSARTTVFHGAPEKVLTEWVPSNALLSMGPSGLLDFSAGLRGLRAGGDDAIYGTLWYKDPLPLNGTVVAWTFMWPESTTSHDMNWWFPSCVRNNSAYVEHGSSDPFYVWGLAGWGGALAGVERSDGGSSLAAAPMTMQGRLHDALYYSLNGTQYFILDGALVSSFMDGNPVNGTHGYFALSTYQSRVLLGPISIYHLD